MLEAGMLLAKWSSNSSSLTDKVSAELGSKYIECEHIKILAVKWTPLGDIFTFGGIDIATDIAPTKRIVLGCIARLFDHFGFLSPFIMTAKCLFQELWQIGIDKDESRPASLLCFFQSHWGNLEGIELHSFVDAASPKGYGAVVYIRKPNPDGTYQISFVIAKTKVALLKR